MSHALCLTILFLCDAFILINHLQWFIFCYWSWEGENTMCSQPCPRAMFRSSVPLQSAIKLHSHLVTRSWEMFDHWSNSIVIFFLSYHKFRTILIAFGWMINIFTQSVQLRWSNSEQSGFWLAKQILLNISTAIINHRSISSKATFLKHLTAVQYYKKVRKWPKNTTKFCKGCQIVSKIIDLSVTFSFSGFLNLND